MCSIWTAWNIFFDFCYQGNFKHAYKSYEEQLEKSHDLDDCGIEAQAYGNLGICKMNMGELEDAIGMFEQQLALLEQLQASPAARLDRGRALGNLGDCHEALGMFGNRSEDSIYI